MTGHHDEDKVAALPAGAVRRGREAVMADHHDEDDIAALRETLTASEGPIGSLVATAQDVESALARVKRRTKTQPAHQPARRTPPAADRSDARAMFLELPAL